MSPPVWHGTDRAEGVPAEERELMARLRKGDRAAFAALVGRHGAALLGLARSFTKDGSTAEELVQDAWVAALDGLDGFEERSSIRTWLLHIVSNKARTRLARDGRTIPLSTFAASIGGDDPAVDPGQFDERGAWKAPPGLWTEENPERLAEGAQTRAALERAIAALPEAQRAVLTLRDVEGLEAEEICAILGITIGNQRVLLHRARARVRAALEAAAGAP